LTVEGKVYLYRLDHAYTRGAERADYVFHLYEDGYKAAPARLRFSTVADAIAGAPLNSGVIPVPRTGAGELRLNLNRPRCARVLVCHALERGWKPELESRPRELSLELDELYRIFRSALRADVERVLRDLAARGWGGAEECLELCRHGEWIVAFENAVSNIVEDRVVLTDGERSSLDHVADQLGMSRVL
jgi:hypothetical protein